MSDKSRIVAGLLSMFLGGFGLGRLYLGYRSVGLFQFVGCTLGWFILLDARSGTGVFILVLVWLWTIIDAFAMWFGLVKDAHGLRLR